MDIYWQSSNWQNQNFTLKQAIAFVVSALLVILFLLIPITFQYNFSQQDSIIDVELVKSLPIAPEITEEEIEKNNIEPIVKPIDNPVDPKTPELVTKPKQVAKPKPITKTISATPKLDKPQLPSAGMIISSLKNRMALPTVSKDFQVANENDNTFIYKEILKQKPTLLITDQNVMHEIVNPKDPIALRLGRGLLNYLFVPMKDSEKTQDSLNYCPTLGRKSVFCPNANPLSD